MPSCCELITAFIILILALVGFVDVFSKPPDEFQSAAIRAAKITTNGLVPFVDNISAEMVKHEWPNVFTTRVKGIDCGVLHYAIRRIKEQGFFAKINAWLSTTTTTTMHVALDVGAAKMASERITYSGDYESGKGCIV